MTTVWGLKQKVETTLGIPAFQQRLIARGEELWPENALCSPLLGDATSLHLVRRSPSQAAHVERLCRVWVWEFASEPEELRSDRDLALALVSQDGHFLEYVSPALRDDQEVVRRAVRATPMSFAHASDTLRADRDFVLSLVQASVAKDDSFIDHLLEDPLGVYLSAHEIVKHAAQEVQRDVEVLDAAGMGAIPSTEPTFTFTYFQSKGTGDVSFLDRI